MEKTEFSIQIDTAEEPMKQEEAVSKVHEKLEKQEPLIELRNIYKIYYMGDEEVHANDGISLSINKGEFVAIVGKSGSGKSTLMNIIGALDVPTKGEYFLGGEDVADMSDNELAEIRNRMIGFIFQQYNLLPKLNLLENVELPLLYAGYDKKERRERAMNSLKKVGLDEKWKNLPNQLKALIGHLDARDQMQSGAARNFAQNLKLPFSLYPVRTGAPRSDYAEVSEAYLVLLNRSHRQQYEEMILRLNPLVVRLELQLMKTVLAGKNLRLEDVIDRPYSRRPRFVPDMLAEKLPDVYQSVCTDFGAPLRESDVSMEVCYRILEHLPDVPVDAMPVLKSCNLLNESCRNSLAHQLTAVTAEQITAACGMQPAQLLNQVGKLIAAIYPECDPALFTIYKRCGDYIKSKIL